MEATRVKECCARAIRWACGVVIVVATVGWALGREGHDLPTADLHADAPYYYVYWPALLHGDLDFTSEYRETHNWYHLGVTPIGRVANVFGVGPVIVDAPLLAVAHGVAWITSSRRDGFSTWEVRAYTWTSIAWSLAAVLIAMRLARRRLRCCSAQAFVGPLVCALAGPIVYYAARQPGYAHPMATFFVAWLVERWDASYDQPRTLRTWLVLGALLGASALVRPQLGLWGVLLVAAAIDDVVAWRRAAGGRAAAGRLLLAWLAGAAVTFAVFAPQLVVWKLLYGAWYVVPQGPGFMRWDAPCWSEVLFSSRNGLLPWAPAYAVFAIALAVLARTRRRLVALLGVGIALQVLANGAAWDWWAGGSFGGRRFDSAFVALALGATVVCTWVVSSVPAAMRAGASVRARLSGGAASVTAVVVLALVIANLELVVKTTTTNARIKGGEAAADVWRRECDPVTGLVAAVMSSLANLPARVAFAWRYDAGFDAYDRLVGVYVLGETYPGLNSYPDARVGIVPGPTLDSDGRGHLVVGFNRRGGLDVKVLSGAPVTVTWNGADVGPSFHTDDVRRGVNELGIVAAPGTKVGEIRFEAKDR